MIENKIKNKAKEELIREYSEKINDLELKLENIEKEFEKVYLENDYKTYATEVIKTSKDIEILKEYGLDPIADYDKVAERQKELNIEKERLKKVLRYCKEFLSNMESLEI